MTYDDLNRLARKTVPPRTGLDATHTRDVHFDYDLLGGMESACFGTIGNENAVSAECAGNTFNALGHEFRIPGTAYLFDGRAARR